MPHFADTTDALSRSHVLRSVSSHRVSFDPTNEEHCASLKAFLETGNWGKVMFHAEYPYSDIPTYVLAKYASHNLNAHRLTSAEKQLANSRARVAKAAVEDTQE